MGLLNPRILSQALASPPKATPDQVEIAKLWAESIRNQSIFTQNESQIEGQFQARIVESLLGYQPFGAGGAQNYRPKQPMGKGIVDIALGDFSAAPKITAPFELKGADTHDLDAPMAGRNKTPVQQAWEYANAVSGPKWVLVSNMLEIRLYAFGEGQQDFERIDLSKIDEPIELAKAQLLLSAENLLGTRLTDLLRDSKQADKTLSDRLYTDYSVLRVKLIEAVNAATAGADKVQAVNTAQKILDRVLFAAFAEDRDLIPAKSLQKAFDTQNDYDPYPIWKNFKGLFRAIDEGSDKLKISRYNGGLFKFDDQVDALNLSDSICEEFKKIGDYHFDTEVSITVLGHIFEQSVSDVEKLLAKARGEEEDEPEKPSGVKGRRKRDGIVYTPDYIAKFIVEKTLGTHVDEVFRNTFAQFVKGDVSDYPSLKFKKGVEEKAWVTYRLALTTLRVVDPACGSGVFLVTAFDYLKAEYDRVNKKIAELRGKSDYIVDLEDVDREILSQNLYGVDVNAESVEITKLSLWLKTAKKGKELDSLDHNIRVGDSLIEDSSFAYLKHGFSWNSAFPEVFAAGGFDVVLGNPPYVSGGHFSDLKKYLRGRFEVYHGSADLYCFFYEKGLRLLKSSGRLGYISSSTFFKSDFGTPLRNYLRKESTIEKIVDFQDTQVFEGVTTYTTILIINRMKAKQDHKLEFLKLSAIPEDNFSAAFDSLKNVQPQSNLDTEYWHVEAPEVRRVRRKIIAGGVPLNSIYGDPLYGIKTGANDIFVINGKQRDEIIKKDASSSEIIFPFLEGEDLHRWCSEQKDVWIIFTRRGVDLTRYPAIEFYLSKFRDRLEPKPKGWKASLPNEKWKGRKGGPYKWYELQDACDYWQRLLQPKIIYNRFLSKPEFSLDRSATLTNDAPYSITNGDEYLLGLLNSNALWFIVSARSTRLRGGFYQLLAQFVELLPIPLVDSASRERMVELVSGCQRISKLQLLSRSKFFRRIPDLCPPDRDSKLSTKLQDWWKLDDFAAFRAEVKKCFKADIPLKERSDWEDLFTTGKAAIEKLSAEIKRNEDEINAIVYKLFDLTVDEIALLEESIGAK